MFRPLGFKSIVWTSPKLSSSVEKVGSITPVISFSLHVLSAKATEILPVNSYIVQVSVLWKSASTPSISASETRFRRIIL